MTINIYPLKDYTDGVVPVPTLREMTGWRREGARYVRTAHREASARRAAGVRVQTNATWNAVEARELEVHRIDKLLLLAGPEGHNLVGELVEEAGLLDRLSRVRDQSARPELRGRLQSTRRRIFDQLRAHGDQRPVVGAPVSA